jgi:hypothetical protein
MNYEEIIKRLEVVEQKTAHLTSVEYTSNKLLKERLITALHSRWISARTPLTYLTVIEIIENVFEGRP